MTPSSCQGCCPATIQLLLCGAAKTTLNSPAAEFVCLWLQVHQVQVGSLSCCCCCCCCVVLGLLHNALQSGQSVRRARSGAGRQSRLLLACLPACLPACLRSLQGWTCWLVSEKGSGALLLEWCCWGWRASDQQQHQQHAIPQHSSMRRLWEVILPVAAAAAAPETAVLPRLTAGHTGAPERCSCTRDCTLLLFLLLMCTPHFIKCSTHQ